MVRVIYERHKGESTILASAATYEGDVIKLSTYPEVPIHRREESSPDGYEEEIVEIPLSRVVRVHR